ncbi:hypothetical protein [Streptomyces sp. NPDC004658]|uniref:hypothetical protein n=1 Tax=Streptomyces sp. NPDC004658 TaxID=3154672 RepID=UPI0033AC9782
MAAEPYNRRVRLVVEVRDEPDERELATEVFAAQEGWRVRPARDTDAISAEAGYTALVVDVPLRGSRLSARSTAVEQLTSLASRRRLDVWVREAALVRPGAAEPVTTYHVHHKVPDGAGPVLRWLAEHWVAVGGWDVGRTLHLRGEHTEEQRERAQAELAGRTLGGTPFDPEAHDLRRSLGPAPHDGWAGPRRRSLTVALGCLVAFAGVAAGIVLGAYATPWRFPALLIPAGLCWPVGRWVTSNEPRPWLVALGCGVVLTGGPAFLGFMWARSGDIGTRRQLAAFAVIAVVAFTVFGLWYALSASWFSRNMQWFLPVLAAPVPFVMPWAGSFLHAMYLEDFFGIPVDSVHVAFYWQYAVAFRPLATAVACGLVLLALGGWARHFHVQTGATGLVPWVLPLMLVVAVLTVAVGALNGVEKAADRTMDAVRAGRRPPAYFGLRGELVCVKPLGTDVPVINGPVPVRHPVLSFQASGDTVWLWDPDPARGEDTARHSLRLRAEDVALVRARGTRC